MAAYDEAEKLAQTLIQWVDSAPQGFDPEARAQLLLAYADIGFTRQEFPRARAQYERIAVAKEFEGTLAQKKADLKIAEVDRLTKNFDKAIDRLEKLARRKDAFLQAESNYQLALIKFDQEEYPEARRYLDQVFSVDLNHANARILEGQLYLRMKKLIEATEVKVGLSSSQQTIVPGKPLKIQLQDRNLAVVGRASDIEVRVWTESGDEETFNLLPFGDSKTKFEGQIMTEMGKVVKGDRMLQVLGRDVVHYDFSERFKKANKIAESAPAEIIVMSDAELYASSGKILSREEQEEKALEQLIRSRMKLEEAAAAGVALSTVRADNEIKPGNKINVRVVDPDQNVSTNRDKVTVKVASSSGDRIDAFELLETTPYSGVFEGQIPTLSAPAAAFASDSTEGRDPNQTISAGDYEGWVGLPDNRRPKTFSIDLNSNARLGKIRVTADVPGRRIKKFVLQTSVNGKEFVNACAWPQNIPEWDGSLRMEIVRYAGVNGPPRNLDEFRQYLDIGYETRGAQKIIVTPGPLSLQWDGNVGGYADRLGLSQQGVDSWYIVRISGMFSMQKRQVRTFRIDPKNRIQNIRYLITVDGQPGKDPRNPLEFSGSLSKGAHRLDVYMCAQRNAQPVFEIQQDIPKAPYIAACTPDVFDAGRNPELAASVKFSPASVSADESGNVFEIQFPESSSARVLRLWILDFETDAPAIRKISLTDPTGRQILPVAQDLMTLKRNATLEIVPGDRIVISYEDPRFVTKERQVSEASLTATFHDATLSACFVQSTVDERGNRVPTYIPMRRFKAGDAVNVFISDPDADVSDGLDKAAFTARSASGKPVSLQAVETEEHSGIFLGKVFPVQAAPQRPSEIQVGASEDLIVAYLDNENTDPGIPWERVCVVEQTSDAVPELRIYDVSSRELTSNELKTAAAPAEARQYEEFVPVKRALALTRPLEPRRDTPAAGMLNVPVVAELTYPTIAQSPLSKTAIYVQTESGRKKLGREPEGPFDLNVPGTLRLERYPGDIGGIKPPPGYKEVVIRGNPYASNPLEDGRYTFLVPLKLGEIPDKSMAFEEADESKKSSLVESDTDVQIAVSVPYVDQQGMVKWVDHWVTLPTLAVRGGDKVHVGYPYSNASGATNWIVQTVELGSDAIFDVMDARYRQCVDGIHVGESLYFRVIDPSHDTTDAKDEVMVSLGTSSGTGVVARLSETFGHSGVFKGSSRLVYVGERGRVDEPGVLPVQYGDTVTARYEPSRGNALDMRIQVYKGADGSVLPFTKRFKDPDIAVQTQFTIAESYFEMAKKHRELGQDALARREIAQGKKLLDEAIRDYPTTEARAQAEYLLAELSLEFANDAVNEDEKKKHYTEAVSRFTEIVASYPDSPHAPKAQYKKALTYEKMGLMDQACEEYVKLSYRYPDNELVAETIARLGQYFLAKGKEMLDKANAEPNLIEREKIKMQAAEMNRTAAQVFGRLAVRFPEHRLAARTTVLSAQCYMRAEDYDKAVEVFKKVIDEKKGENDLIAQAMYWSGDCYMKKKDYLNAYRMFKKLTWDYPDTTWAKYARGRLTEEALARVEQMDTSATQ